MAKNNAVGWFEIYVKDIERARKFYESVFGIKLDKLETPAPGIEMWSFPSDMSGYGSPGAICKMEGVPSGMGGTLVYFTCEDCAVQEGRVKSSGGRVHKSKESIGQYGHIALAYDPDGNMIGLHSMK
jgi:predicted enzyme related to lactoylglutathione lyase